MEIIQLEKQREKRILKIENKEINKEKIEFQNREQWEYNKDI